MVYKLEKYRAEADIPPFELEIAEDNVVSIPGPDGDTILAISEVPQTDARRILQLLWGEQYDELMAIVGKYPAGVLPAIAADILEHFKIGHLQAAPGGFKALPR